MIMCHGRPGEYTRVAIKDEPAKETSLGKKLYAGSFVG